MNSIEANIRDNSTKGQLNAIRNSGYVPAIIYGGKDKNQKISISKKLLQTFIEKEINDYDFERIDKYWKEISVKEFEELGNLGSINIQEWKLIEEAFG